MVKKLLLCFLCVDAIVLSVIYIQQLMHPPRSGGMIVEIELQGRPPMNKQSHRLFTVFEFPATKAPSALVLFGSGDGGWGHFEERISRALQAKGYTVMGIDSADYAKTDYDLATLQADYSTIVQKGLEAYPTSPPPVIIGGWSMGAAQAVAAAGGPNPPPGVVGLLLVSPLSRGRYGLRVTDRVDILPTGPGTFALADFIQGLNNMRIVQWHATNDSFDSTAWLPDLRTAHREFDFPNIGHDYGGAIPPFLDQLVESVAWILNPSAVPQ